MRFALLTIILMICVSGEASAQSQTIPDTPFPTAPAVTNKIVAEDEYAFAVRRYDPPVEVKTVAREKASYRTPEATTVALISAMSAQDFEWFRSLWDAGSLRIMEARDNELNQDRKFWTSAWERALKDRKVELTDRIESGDYVFIAYRLVPIAGSAEVVELITALKSQAGRWFATQELSTDPVLLYWKTPNVRPKRTIRGLNDVQK